MFSPQFRKQPLIYIVEAPMTLSLVLSVLKHFWSTLPSLSMAADRYCNRYFLKQFFFLMSLHHDSTEDAFRTVEILCLFRTAAKQGTNLWLTYDVTSMQIH